jgi:hypothetical protein
MVALLPEGIFPKGIFALFRDSSKVASAEKIIS